MKIGILKEIKAEEHRVSITPNGVDHLVRAGQSVFVETNAGKDSGFSDDAYQRAGATILSRPEQVFSQSDLIVKVKEPQPSEYTLFKPGQILFTYLHLAANRELTEALLKADIIGVAYETVELENGRLPLLEPMSEIAGRLAPQMGSQFLQNAHGGTGVLLSGVPGVPPARVVVVGGGIVGSNAVKIALGLGAHVSVLDVNTERLRWFDETFVGRIETIMSNPFNLEEAVEKADLVIGAVLIRGAKAPKLIKEYMVKSMRKGAVIVDVAIDQGGSVETVDHPTTHKEPTYVKYGVIHYAVANIPGTVGKTATKALTNVTLPYVEQIAKHGIERALENDPSLGKGLNLYRGQVTYKAVAEALQLPLGKPKTLVGV